MHVNFKLFMHNCSCSCGSNERLVLHGLANCASKILYSMNRALIANHVATYISIGAIWVQALWV